jgi:hypothetical protein
MPIERNHTVSTRRPFFGVILAVNRQATLARSLRDKDALWAPVSVLLGKDELLLIRVLPPDMIVSKPDERELSLPILTASPLAGAGLSLYFLLLSTNELDGARRLFVQIAISQKVSEDRNVAPDIASRQKKWFHYHCPLIIDFL